MTSLTRNEIFEIFDAVISNFAYLRERSWFATNDELQQKLLTVVRFGLSDQVFVLSGDFSEHLDELIESAGHPEYNVQVVNSDSCE